MSPDPDPSPADSPTVAPPSAAGAVAADQAGAQAIETPARAPQGPFHTHCENCGTALAGPWCHHCGQHDFEFHRSFVHVFWEALESFFHFEGKFFRNIVTLLFQPGRLTARFNAGKRAAQMPPFRLYVFVSFLFFFLLFLGDRPATDPVQLDQLNSTAPAGRPAAAAEALADARRDLQDNPAGLRVLDEVAKVVDAAPARSSDTPAPPTDGTPASRSDFERQLEAKARQALAPESQRQLVDAFLAALPKMLLVCLPFFALYTRVLFRKSGQVYLQHLVLALHFHTFIYLFVLFRDGWAFLAGLPDLGLRRWVVLACNLWLIVYPFLMLRHLYANSWLRTILKTTLLAAAYGLTLATGFFVTALILFLSL